MNRLTQITDIEARTRMAYWVSVLFTLIFAAVSVIFSYIAWQNPSTSLFILVGMMEVIAVVSGYSIYLSRKGKAEQGLTLALAVILIALPLSSFFVSGLGVFLGIAQFIGISIIVRLIFRQRPAFVVANLVSSIFTVFLDVAGSPNRYHLPITEVIIPGIVATGLALIALIFLREFKNFRLRVKVVLGILISGSSALAVVVWFAANSTTQVTNALSSRLETSVQLLAEEQLINTVTTETEKANIVFENVETSVAELAAHWSGLQLEQVALSQNNFWDANTALIRLDGGHFGNSTSDLSSVYVPAKVVLTEGLLNDLNTSAYLDFSAPSLLQTNPNILAVYGIDTRGVTRYYPNINLASLLPPDFDPTERPYYKITSPLFNAERSTRWAIPYVDAAGGGLVVTVAAPVYVRDSFNGIVAADMQLATITKQIEDIKVGTTGFAFMIDDAGRVISMPLAGYDIFGITPADINSEEYFKQTILGAGTDDLVEITNRMVAGGNGLVTVPIEGVDNYLSFAPVRANGYSVGIIVPVKELQTAIVTARSETESQLQAATRQAIIILVSLMLIASFIALGIGGVIAGPIVRLTETANRIVNGDLNAQAVVSTRDETGTLAGAFNTMTLRLRESLASLEQRVDERTSELTNANRQIEQRALQFESIARVARTISSTSDLDSLLQQITLSISRQFGFYHVGIFLLDPGGEYAVLSAANSEGGKIMLANNHQLKVGEIGIVGRVTADGTPRVALDTELDAAYFDNPYLPDTRSEIALPLLAGKEVIGALDVQSTAPNAFSDEDVSILSILADQVSIAIQNARQFEQTQKALAEAESLSKQLARVGWQEFSKSRKLVGVRHSGARSTILYEKNGKDANDAEPREETSRPAARTPSLSIPIKMRGEVIGTVDVKTPGNRQWDQDEMDIVTAIIDRAALALENARFVEESQKRVVKERMIGEISAKISAQRNIEELLQTAVLELSRTLPDAEVAIQFNEPSREAE